MDYMTAEQAAEAAKGLTFEIVWAALMESRKKRDEDWARIQERMQESWDKIEKMEQKRIEDSKLAEQKRIEDLKLAEQKRIEDLKLAEQREQKRDEDLRLAEKKRNDEWNKNQKDFAMLRKEIGGISNTLGRMTESMFSHEIWKKFNDIGYTFSRQGPQFKFIENNQVLAEADFWLENGEYVMPVEIKTDLKLEDINDHIERINKIRRYLNARNDRRILIGAVAGVIIP